MNALAGEIEFQEIMTELYRRAGRSEAFRILEQLQEQSEDGASQAELINEAQAALSALPCKH